MIEGRWSGLGHVVSPGLGYSRGRPRPSFLLGGRVYFRDYQWVTQVESGVQVRPQPNTFIIYKGVVAYAISQLRFDMITLKLESHAVSHAMSSAFVLVKKQNLESSTSFLFLCLKRLETGKVYKYKFHTHVP